MGERTCAVEGCERTGQLTRGWCRTHYMRWWSKGDTGPAEIGTPGQGTPFGGGRHRVFDDAPVCRRGGTLPPRSHCQRGHEMTDENTILAADNGGRRCRQCRKDRQAERRDEINARRRERRATKKAMVI